MSQIIIKENISLTNSNNITHKTIPIFIGYALQSTKQVEFIGKINNWLEFSSLFDISETVKIDLSSSAPSYTFGANNELAYCVRLYFDNGGGPFYLISSTFFSSEWINNISNIITESCSDGSIICIAWAGSGVVVDIENNINSNLSTSNKYFYIADGKNNRENNSDNPRKISTREEQTAMYHPNLLSNYHYIRVDRNIPITGHSNSEVKYLSDLANVDTELYGEICNEIDTNYTKKNPVVFTSAAIAAAYCSNDTNRGVWKAPANIQIKNATPIFSPTEQQINDWFQKGVNTIRKDRDKGTLIWGARTLASKENSQWKHISVRRLFNTVEKDLSELLESLLFKPNIAVTWGQAQAMVENYLYNLWHKGAFAGKTPQDSYYVEIGKDITMRQNDIDTGKMVVNIGIAPSTPAEFIILTFVQVVGANN